MLSHSCICIAVQRKKQQVEPRTVEVSQEGPEQWKTGETALAGLSIYEIHTNCDFDQNIHQVWIINNLQKGGLLVSVPD